MMILAWWWFAGGTAWNMKRQSAKNLSAFSGGGFSKAAAKASFEPTARQSSASSSTPSSDAYFRAADATLFRRGSNHPVA